MDDFKTAIVPDGGTLALSAAMPGLVGAVLRKGGLLSPFRSSISHRGTADTGNEHEGTVTIKLFNLLMAEIGGVFTTRGIRVRPASARHFFNRQPRSFWQSCKSAEVNGKAVPLGDLPQVDWQAIDGLVAIRVAP